MELQLELINFFIPWLKSAYTLLLFIFFRGVVITYKTIVLYIYYTINDYQQISLQIRMNAKCSNGALIYSYSKITEN